MALKLIKNSHSGMTQISGRVGKIAAILDAALVDGGPTVSITVTVDTLVATATASGGHTFAVGEWVTIAGGTPVGVNGDVQILSVDGNDFTYATAAADGAATGTITAKLSPLGFATAYTGTNLRVYRAAAGERDYCRVDDTNEEYALVRGYNAMSGISTGTGPYPTVLQATDGVQWFKNDVAEQASAVSVTSITVDNGVATVVATAHGAMIGDWVLIAGATGLTGLNGLQRVYAKVDADTFTFLTEEDDGTAGGTITSLVTTYPYRKWAVIGDANHFYFLVERKNDVYDLYAFGETNTVLSATVANVLSGLLNGNYALFGNPTLTSGKIETYLSNKPSELIPNVDAEAILRSFTTTRALNDLQASDVLSRVFVRDSGLTVGELDGVYAPSDAKAPLYTNFEEVTMAAAGETEKDLVAFKVVCGSPGYVGNVFFDMA